MLKQRKNLTKKFLEIKKKFSTYPLRKSRSSVLKFEDFAIYSAVFELGTFFSIFLIKNSGLNR